MQKRTLLISMAGLAVVLTGYTSAGELKTMDGTYAAPERRQEIIHNLKELKQYVPAIADQQATMDRLVSSATFGPKGAADNKAGGVLDSKTKLLISIAVISSVRCGDCVSLFLEDAARAGLTKKQILEAATVAIAFQGGPTMGFIATDVMPTIDEYGIK